MLKQLQNRRDQTGFTIIEVMIVLAIAALILLIVLLAVPALQRNSRNTTIKNDAASVTGAISTFESDNNGDVPTNLDGVTTPGTVVLSKGTQTESIKVNGSTFVKTDAASPTFAGINVGADPGATGATSTVYAYAGHSCADSGLPVSTTANVSGRSIALYYLIETSGGKTLQCVSA